MHLEVIKMAGIAAAATITYHVMIIMLLDWRTMSG